MSAVEEEEVASAETITDDIDIDVASDRCGDSAATAEVTSKYVASGQSGDVSEKKEITMSAMEEVVTSAEAVADDIDIDVASDRCGDIAATAEVTSNGVACGLASDVSGQKDDEREVKIARTSSASAGARQRVMAFYRANDHPDGYLYVHVPGPSPPLPLAGLSAGWLPGEVLPDEDAADSAQAQASVRVRFSGWFCDAFKGVVEGIVMKVPSRFVTPVGNIPCANGAGEAGGGQVGPSKPMLSILCVRWSNYWATRWYSDYNITSGQMLVELFDGPCGPNEVLPGEHEVHTVFVRTSADLRTLSDHWAAGALRGTHRVAWYFLWPTARSPASEMKAGCVCERDYFDLTTRLERTGIRSGWPHPSHLYRILCGKLWVSQMCLNRDYKVPPTTRVHYQEFAADSEGAAVAALDRLSSLTKQVWAQEAAAATAFRGVAKLGFSWQGKDVIPFVGVGALRKALRKLFASIGDQQVVCMVQAMVPSVVCEIRALVFWDAKASRFVHEKVYMRLWEDDSRHASNVAGFAATSATVVRPSEAAAAFFGGHEEVRTQVESQVDTLMERWLLWFSTECAEPPCNTRLDFLVSWSQETPESAPSVWTCEVTECGSSLCGLKAAPRTAAALNFAMRHHHGGRFPRPLPPLQFH
eukprot:TRINITY_DN31917_c0_g1_i1.p1 TRINITY_DN31917_c0_g1~~TRINITY_DN31917_c0_g1_i1.p1  ORF type:complete len:643 (-),score=123.49 TRINITY_DN31917_c0_g1_i1:55-1983(-)